MAIRKVAERPQFMQPGSHGPVAVAVNAFLAGYSVTGGGFDSEFVADDVYGERAAAMMKQYQDDSSLEADGGCGPATQPEMKSDGFDLDVAARCLPGVTIFVQPDGEELAWSPDPGWAQEVADASITLETVERSAH